MNKVIVDSDIFAHIMMDWISRHVCATNTVRIQLNTIMNENFMVVKKVSNPDLLSNGIA